MIGVAKRLLPRSVRQQIRRALLLRNVMIARAFFAAQMASSEVRDEYDRLLARNLASILLRVMTRFYEEMGLDPRSVPLVAALDSFLRDLPAGDTIVTKARARSVLVQFEKAFALLHLDQTDEAFVLFESVFGNRLARMVARYDSVVREAVVRSGEFLGRYHDKRGNTEACIRIYREIMSIDRNGMIAHRLMVLLARSGDFQGAAEYGDAAMQFQLNLFRRLPDNNPYIVRLKKQFSTV